MGELFDAAVSPANILITILAIFILAYWITVIIGIIDLDVLDIDVDFDLDADADGLSISWLNSVLAFFNLGEIPLMIFMSFLIIPAWAVMMIVTDSFGITGFFMGLLVLIPVLFVCLFVAKILTLPFVRLFERLNKEELENDVIVGKICEVTMTVRFDKIGQARVLTRGAPHLLNVHTSKGVEMNRGDHGLIIEFQEEKNVYLIEPYSN